MMARISVTVYWSLMIFYVLVKTQALAKPANRLAKTTSSPIGTQHCNNVYFYEAPNKKIATMLKEIKEKLGQLQTDINILKGNNSNENGKNSF